MKIEKNQIASDTRSCVISSSDLDGDLNFFQNSSINLQGYFRKFGNNAAAKIPVIELIGDHAEYRKLALILAKISLSTSEKDIVLKLVRKNTAEINAIVIPKKLNVASFASGINIQSVIFACEAVSSIATRLRADCLPWFGFIDSRDHKQTRLDYDLPDWVQSAIVFQSTSNALIQLAKLLFDMSYQTSAEYSGLILTHQDGSVCSGSYEAGFWLSGSEYDLYEYDEYY